MPKRRKSSTTKKPRKHGMRGKGIGSSIMSGLQFIKDNKLISKGLGLIPHPGAQTASTIAGLIGLGRKRRSRTSKRSSSVVAVPKVRSRRTRRLVPITSPLLPYPAAASSRSRRVMRGRGIFGDLGGGIGSIFGGLGSGVGSIAHGLFGGGRKGSLSGRSRRNVVAV